MIDRSESDPADAQPDEAPSFERAAPLTTRGTVPSVLDAGPPADERQSTVDDEVPHTTDDDASDDAPPTEAEQVGYDDPSESPVDALRGDGASTGAPAVDLDVPGDR